MPRIPPPLRTSFPYLHPVQTRWSDNDVYGHLNNVVYYLFFDTTVNRYLIENSGLDPTGSGPIGLVVETGCQYFSSISFPDEVHVGLRVAEIGRSSVRYELAVFREQEVEASATGHFVHVYVDRESRRPTPVPEKLQKILRPLLGIATAA